MLCKPFGKTGKMVSVIGCGGMRFADPNDIDTSAETVYHAYQGGVNYFDTGPGYCNDKSEDIMGAAVRRMKPGTFWVSTKTFADTEDKLKADLERSLKRLGVPKIHFYHIWCILSLDAWKKRQAGVAAAIKAKEQGLIEHLCVSSHMPGDELKHVLSDAPFEGVTLGYCAINFPYRQAAVDAAGQNGLGVVAMNPLGGGIIPQHAQRFEFLRGPQDRTVNQAALRFVISQPSVTSALVGFADKAQVDEALTAVKDFTPYGAAHIAGIQKRVMESFNGLCTGCGYCLPCPAGVEVPKMMDTFNQQVLTGDPQQMIPRLKWHWGTGPEAATQCTECGVCETRCTQKLPIRERMKEIGKLKA